MAVKYEYITKPESFLGFFKAIKCMHRLALLGPFTDHKNIFPFPFIYFNY